jgi:hypothetical protein
MWTLVVFFGATVLFGAIRTSTEGEGIGVQLGAQAVAALLLIGALVLFVRRRR